MYRVVLIDDEQIIIKGLSKVVNWGEYGCSVVGTASNAAEGLEVIRSLKPDIVFTDIRMADRDGLSMLAELAGEFPDMQITVLTGFRDFSYAQEAIRLGVTRYLLKPSKMDEINEALMVMTEKLNRLRVQQKKPVSEEMPAGSFIIHQALSYMEQNYSRKLTLQDVASACFVSQWHLSKLINKHTEKSFYDLLNAIRIEKAKELLNDPSLKIGDIVDKVGFSDGAHFARVFKKMVGCSANEYRNHLK